MAFSFTYVCTKTAHLILLLGGVLYRFFKCSLKIILRNAGSTISLDGSNGWTEWSQFFFWGKIWCMQLLLIQFILLFREKTLQFVSGCYAFIRCLQLSLFTFESLWSKQGQAWDSEYSENASLCVGVSVVFLDVMDVMNWTTFYIEIKDQANEHIRIQKCSLVVTRA